MKVRVTMNQERLDRWNVPNLKTGDILWVSPSDDGFAFLIVDDEISPDFWLSIPQSFAVVLK